MLAHDNVVDIVSAVTPWKRACAGQRSLKMCESFQSAARGAAAVITLARVSRPLPSTRPRRPASAWVICASDRLDGLGFHATFGRGSRLVAGAGWLVPPRASVLTGSSAMRSHAA